MSALRAALGDYLRIRRQLGFTMPQEGRLLVGFVGFAERAGADRITTSLALAWARIPVNAHPHTWRQRPIVLRGFARHLATIDPASEVPPADLLPGHRPWVTPFIYSGEEIAALLEAARRLRPTLRAARHQTLIGLLAVTGCRPGELLALDRQDVGLTHGRIHVRAGKQNRWAALASCVSSESTCWPALEPLVLMGDSVSVSLDSTGVQAWEDRGVLGCLTTPCPAGTWWEVEHAADVQGRVVRGDPAGLPG
jgi:site-specific recombinase XerC